MDFSKHDTRSMADKPRFLHLRDTVSGDLIWDGDVKCGVMVIGSSSRKLHAEKIPAAREALESAKTEDEKHRLMIDVHNQICESASHVIDGFVGVARGKTELDPANKEDLDWFLDLNFVSLKDLMRQPGDDSWLGASFAQQIIKFSTDLGNYAEAD